MAREVRDGRSVDASSCVDIDSIYDLVCGLCILVCLVLVLILARWCEQQATIGGEGETSEEGSQSLVCVKACILHAKSEKRRGGMRLGGRFHGHYSGQW